MIKDNGTQVYTDFDEAYRFLEGWGAGDAVRDSVAEISGEGRSVSCIEVSLSEGVPSLATFHWGRIPADDPASPWKTTSEKDVGGHFMHLGEKVHDTSLSQTRSRGGERPITFSDCT